jgi:hypothetical protein
MSSNRQQYLHLSHAVPLPSCILGKKEQRYGRYYSGDTITRRQHRGDRCRSRTVQLWSDVSNGGSQEDGKDDDDAPGADEKMTLRRASKLFSTFWSMAFPYYQESQPGRRLFIGMVLLTLVNSGVSVAFSYVSKDFWNALSSKDTQEFYSMMIKYGGALVVGAPVSVLYR